MKRTKLALAITTLGTAGIGLASFISSSAVAQQEPPFRRPPRPIPPIWPPRPMPPRLPSLQELVVSKQNAKVEIKNGMARVVLTQTLNNTRDTTVEGEFLWAVPVGAAISDFSMTSNGKKLSAEILNKDKAREIYNGIVQKWRDPAILEFVDRDLLRAKLFPIPAKGNIEVELVYSQPIKDNRFVLPLKSPNGARPAAGGDSDVKTNVDVVLSAQSLKAVLSPSHKIDVKRDGDTATISGEFSGDSRDFSLLWTRGEGAIGVQLQTFKPVGEDAYFLLLAAPDTSKATPQVASKEVVFVFDTSGSMDGPKIEQARRAMKNLLSNLNPTDKFGIVTFASSANTFRDELVPATPENINAARSFADGIRALGGTNIEEALQTALKMGGGTAAKPRQVIFLTDGQPTVGETKLQPLLDGAKTQNKNARIWTFGLGFDVNTRLLDSLAEENGGASDYVLPEEDIEEKVGSLYGKIAYPILQNTNILWGGASVYDVYPRQTPEIFRGGQMVILGRIKGDLKGEVALEGDLGGAKKRFDGAVSSDGTNEISKLWATRKIGFLIDDARRSGKPIDGEIKDEILSLSKKYGVVSPLTAALITEDEPIVTRVPDVTIQNGGVIAPMARGAFGGGSGGFGGRADAAAPMFRAPATGQSAVIASKATREMREGVAAPGSSVANIQIVAGKTFVLRGEEWTDEDFSNEKFPKVREVKAYSPEYFELAKTSEIAKWFSLGEKIVFVWKGEAIRVS